MINNFKHVCFKDLEDYVRKDDYFEGYSNTEKKFIRENLNLISEEDIEETVLKYLEGYTMITHELLYNMVSTNTLVPNQIYIISDFQTIYESNTGEIWGLDNHPSKSYKIILESYTENTLSLNVMILSDDVKSLLWEVKYDITPVNGNKGTITFLKDENGNSAFYDFKNILYRIDKDTLSKIGITEEFKDYYTFNQSSSNVKILEKCDINIFVKEAHDIIINSNCNNNIFNCNVNNTILNSGTSGCYTVNKLFSDPFTKTLSYGLNKPLVNYIDLHTLTVQNYEIDNIY